MNFLRIVLSAFVLILLFYSCSKKENSSSAKTNPRTINPPLSLPSQPETIAISPSESFPPSIENLQDIKPTEPYILVPIAPVSSFYPVISCFDPNITMESAVELLQSDAVDTQWFIVERKKVPDHSDYFVESDTIQLREKLKTSGWVLIDSSQTKVGNQVKILVSFQKEERICNIEKILYLHPDKKNHEMEETCDIRRNKKNPDLSNNN